MGRRAICVVVGLSVGSALATQIADPLDTVARNIFQDIFQDTIRSGTQRVVENTLSVRAFGFVNSLPLLIVHSVPVPTQRPTASRND